MVNEEDHLRLQALRSGFALRSAYAGDRQAGPRTGRTTFRSRSTRSSASLPRARPTSGTGLRASVLIHLPGLVLTKEIAKVLQGLAADGPDLPRAVRRGQRGRRQLLPDLQPDDAGEVRGGAARPPGRVVAAGDRARRRRRAVCCCATPVISSRTRFGARTARCATRAACSFDEAMNLPERRAAGRRAETDLRPQCIYPQQAADLHASRRTSSHRGGTDADGERGEPGARAVRAAGAGRAKRGSAG